MPTSQQRAVRTRGPLPAARAGSSSAGTIRVVAPARVGFAPVLVAVAISLTLPAAAAADRDGGARRVGHHALRNAVANEAELARAGAKLIGDCRQPLLDELARGQRSAAGCELERAQAGRAAVRLGTSFGFVASREVDLRGVRLVVGRAELCRRWPLRAADASVLRPSDIEDARCKQRRTREPLRVTVIARAGKRIADVHALLPDADGRVTFDYAELDLRLRALGLGNLDDYATVELGEDAWAGTVDLQRLREFRAAWHLRWVREGRGSAGLFAVRYGSDGI